MPQKECTVTIINRLGLHARPAMSFVDTAQTFKAAIRVRNGDTDVDGKSIMEVMMLAATKGTNLLITADGDDADKALDELKKLVASGFDEE